MAKIPLRHRNQTLYALVDESDLPLLKEIKVSFDGRYVRTNKKPRQMLHKLIVPAPPGMFVDHIDGDRLNNQRSNLRICSHQENARNSHKTERAKSSVFKGVYWHGSKETWKAAITIDRKMCSLGAYSSETDAAKAYDDAARRHFGDFARVNFPTQGEQGCLRKKRKVAPPLDFETTIRMLDELKGITDDVEWAKRYIDLFLK